MSGLTLKVLSEGRRSRAPLYRSVPQAAKNDPELYAKLEPD
ncbi:hypothetical protein QUA00_19615 [Microcoleus sp. T2B6]